MALLLASITFFVVPLQVIAATYGEGTYGEGLYNQGEEEVSSQESGSSNSIPAPPVCTDTPPGEISPWLFSAIPQSESTILLQFTDAESPVSHYVLEFGTKPGIYPWSAQNIGGNGTESYLVGSLSPNATYYFRVRGSNGCATGPWSNEISAKTKGLISINEIDIVDSEVVPSSPIPSPTPTSQEQPEAEIEEQSGYLLNVKVVDISQAPVQGAKVEVHSEVQSAITDENGVAKFENVLSGQHTVLVSYDGYEGEQGINLSGENKEVNITITIELKKIEISPIVLIAIVAMGITIVILVLLLIRAKRSK